MEIVLGHQDFRTLQPLAFGAMLFQTLSYSPFCIAGIAGREIMVDPKDAVLGALGDPRSVFTVEPWL
jgi:hypothetical protein